MDSCKTCAYWERGKTSSADGFGICKNTSMFLKTGKLSLVKNKNVVLMANSGDSTFLTGEDFCCRNFKSSGKQSRLAPIKKNIKEFDSSEGHEDLPRVPSKRARDFYGKGTLKVDTNKPQIPQDKQPIKESLARTPTPRKMKQVNKETGVHQKISIEDAFAQVFKEEQEKKSPPKPAKIGRRIHNQIVKSSSTILRGTYKKVKDEKTGEHYLVTVIGDKAVSKENQKYLNLFFYLGALIVFGVVGYTIFQIIIFFGR